MMKKTALVMAVMFALSGISFAGEGKLGKAPQKMESCSCQQCACKTSPGQKAESCTCQQCACKSSQRINPEQKAKWEAVQKERTAYLKELQTLTAQYNKASDKDKTAIRGKLTALISKQTDKDIAMKEKMLAAKKEEIAKFEASIAEMKTDKTAFVNKKADFWLSEEGQAKIQKMQEMKDKKDMKKKDGKERKDKKDKGDKKFKK